MHLLEPVLEHGAVTFPEEIFVDVDVIVRVNSQEVGVVGRMVDLAHAQAIGHDRNSMFVGIRDDVRCVE